MRRDSTACRYDRRVLHRFLALAALLLGLGSAGPATAQPPPAAHVFVIVLENKDAEKTFAPGSPAPYLSQTLRRQGVLVPGYYGIGHLSLDNYIAMVSGQSPNPQTQADCQLFTDFLPGTIGAGGQALGTGCVYPAKVKTIADQLESKGLTWKGYMEDMGKDPARDHGTTCAHPAIGARDTTQSASATDQYATRHNPFVYFHSLIDRPTCAANNVPLDRLTADLASADRTPSLAFITPDLCNDAHDASCPGGGPGGLAAADAFLREWVPRITSSPAFARGLLIVTFDEAEDDATACCNEPTGPNTPNNGGTSSGRGGGRVGAVLVSPYIRPGTTSAKSYNHYSLLRSLEDLFALPHLGYAAADGLEPFGGDIYTAPAVSRLSLTRSSFRVGRPTTIGVTLDRAATVRLRFTRARARTRVLTRRGHAGRNAIRFSGRVGGRALSAGRWRLAASASAGGLSGPALTRSFTVLPG
jgi:hypothetical protein